MWRHAQLLRPSSALQKLSCRALSAVPLTPRPGSLQNIYGPDYGRMVCKFPQLLGLQWDTTIEPKLDYLQSIGFSDMHQCAEAGYRV